MSDKRREIAERYVPRTVRTVYEGSCGIDYDVPRSQDAEFQRTLAAMSSYAAAVLEEMAVMCDRRVQEIRDAGSDYVSDLVWTAIQLRARAAQERER